MNDDATKGRAHAQILALLERYKVEDFEEPAVDREVAEWIANPGFDDGLVDREALPFVTIDNDDSRDLDQALYLERDGDGYQVWYAIADAAYYVRPGSALHARAMRRHATYYLPQHAVRMLPAGLSEGIVSLNADAPRRAVMFITRLDAAGQVIGSRIERSRIRSRAKLSYNGVQQAFDTHEAAAFEGVAYGPSLQLLREVGELRIAEARARDVVDYERREASVGIDPSDPDRFVVNLRERNQVERWNEQISLLCNIEGARVLDRLGRLDPELQAVFRVHLPPMQKRLASLREQLAAIVQAHGLEGAWMWGANGRESLADYLERLPREDATEGIRHAIDRQVRQTNRASEFSPSPGPHHALGVDAYARFSAPMREMVGVFSHKELLEGLALEPPQDRAADELLRVAVIAGANEARSLQKRLDKELALIVIDALLRRDLEQAPDARPTRSGTIMGIERNRIYVALEDFALDLKVYMDDLCARFNCTFELAGATLRPSVSDAPTYRVGDAVTVRTDGWDEERRRFVLDVRPATR